MNDKDLEYICWRYDQLNDLPWLQRELMRKANIEGYKSPFGGVDG